METPKCIFHKLLKLEYVSIIIEYLCIENKIISVRNNLFNFENA